MAEISLEPAPPQARPKGPDLPSLPTTESETDDEDADIENCEDRPLLSMAGGPGKGEGGIPLGNFNYPVTSDSGPQPSLTCANLPPTPLWQMFGIFRAGRIWVFAGEGLSDGRQVPPKVDWAIGPCWPMLLLTYALVIGISCSLFSMSIWQVPLWLRMAAISLLLCSVYSLSCVGCRDPGIVPRIEVKELQECPELADKVAWSHAAQCYYKPVRGRSVSWDSETQTLQYDFDHFCPWMGTAVSGDNIRAFYMFLVSVFALLGMVGVLGYYAMQATPKRGHALSHCPEGTRAVLTQAGYVCRKVAASSAGKG